MKRNICLLALFILQVFAAELYSAVPPNSALSINRSYQFLPVGAADTLQLLITDDDYKNYTVDDFNIVWFTRDFDIAEINTNGVLTAKKAGETIIYAQSLSYDSITLSCSLEVFIPDLPLVYLTVSGEIVDEPKIPGWMKVIDEKGRETYNNHIGIEIRGSSTKRFPKKQYGIETRYSAHPDSNFNVSLLSLPEENDWVFNGPYSDKSLIRNVIIFNMAGKMNGYASRYRFFELYLNGDYRGVYVLFEKIKRDKNRVDIIKNDESNNQAFIVKRDKFDGIDNKYFNTAHGDKIQYHYPKPRDLTGIQESFIRNYILEAESALYSSNFRDETTGYRKYFDVDSWVDYLLIQQICKNNDGFHFSNFMYRDKSGKLVHGPVWDFNLAFANVNYNNCENPEGWWYYFWNSQLMKDRYFADRVEMRWDELRDTVFKPETIHHFIDSTTAAIHKATIRNFKRWPILGIYVWPNYVFPPTYGEEISFLKNWISQRVAWIDENIEEFTTVQDTEDPAEEPQLPEEFELLTNYPNPFNPVTAIRYNLPERSHVKLEIFSVTGQYIATLVNRERSAGFKETVWNSAGNGKPIIRIIFLQINNAQIYGSKKNAAAQVTGTDSLSV